MKTISTKINIAASKERIWEVLTDFSRYPEWNPFIRKVEGKAEMGAALKISIQQNKSKTLVFKPKITLFDPPNCLEWIGRLPLKVFQGKHCFYLKEIGGNQVELHHFEEFRGLMHQVIVKRIKKSTQAGFEAMNQAIKKRAEAL